MTADSAVELLSALRADGVDVCLSGGWGVDALLGRQTRDHEDLDLWVPADHTAALFETLVARGVDRVAPWPGNRPWNFPMHGGRLRVDLHFYEEMSLDEWHYGSLTGGWTFPSSAFRGQGSIDGVDIRCEAPEWSLRFHTGYPIREVDRHDVPLLCQRFDLPLPEEYA